jgi:hypothetical protein
MTFWGANPGADRLLDPGERQPRSPCDALLRSEDCPARTARGYGFPYIAGGPLTIGCLMTLGR